MGTRRIIDANLNRASEAARVVEDIARFHISSAALAAEAKSIRHTIRKLPDTLGIDNLQLLESRDAESDVLRAEVRSPRNNMQDIACANFKRLEEAFRVLEEVAPSASAVLSNLRYQSYSLEKRMVRLLGCRSADVLAGPCLYAIVTRNMVPDPLAFIGSIVGGGCGLVQLREKSLEDRDFLEYAAASREITAKAGALLIINDRPDICRAVGADGVHVGQEDMHPEKARDIVGNDRIVGVSTHSEEEVHRACRDGADYIGFGPVFETKTKDRPAVSPEALKHAVDISIVPVYAIGGIGPENVSVIVDAGTRCAAACSSLTLVKDYASTVENILRTLQRK